MIQTYPNYLDQTQVIGFGISIGWHGIPVEIIAKYETLQLTSNIDQTLSLSANIDQTLSLSSEMDIEAAP